MSNIELAKGFKAQAAITAYTLVALGSADGQVVAAAAVSDKIIGVTTDVAPAINERCDVILSGIADVLYGGTVARGDLLTSDASGRAVTAAPSAGTNNRVIGFALLGGVVGDIGQVYVNQSMMQG